MSFTETFASGLDAVNLASLLLQRARLEDPDAGVWEAADLQWWWCTPRESDNVEQVFWSDDEGPIAGAYLSSWGKDRWQCDPILAPNSPALDREAFWHRTMQRIQDAGIASADVPIADSDHQLRVLAERDGFKPVETDSTAWMNPSNRPAIKPIAEGFELYDRSKRPDSRHMSERNGERVTERLEQCSLYRPELDLFVESGQGEMAGYSLYWFDPVTRVGMIEPMRVEDSFQRRGLATSMLTVGIDRLAAMGVERIKVSYQTEQAGRLYESVGFETTSTTTWYHTEL